MSSTDGGFGSSGWQIVDHDSFDESVLQCGGHKDVDEGLAFVEEALNKNPLGFKRLQEGSDIYVVKTKLRITPGRVIPAYRLLFTVNKETRTVTKLHVQMSHPEDMSYGRDPWDDGECPY